MPPARPRLRQCPPLGFAALCALLLATYLPAAARNPEPPMAECTLSARWSDNPPYGVRLPDGALSGYYAEAVREAGRRVGCAVEFVEMNWARGLHELAAGRLDLMAGAFETPERARIARFTRPINLAPTLMFLDAEAAQAWPLPNLAALAETPLWVGVTRGSRYSDEYLRLLAEPRFAARLHQVPDVARGWRMLSEGRLDGIISDQSAGFLHGVGLPGGRQLVPVLVISAQPAKVMAGRHLDVALFEELDAAFGAMIAEGWLPQLREAWIPCAVDPATMGCRTGERIPAAEPPPRGRGGVGTAVDRQRNATPDLAVKSE